MNRDDLEKLSKQQPVEMVLKLQRPAKTSRASSKPPSTDKKERREQSEPGGAKPGHEDHSRSLHGHLRRQNPLPMALHHLRNFSWHLTIPIVL